MEVIGVAWQVAGAAGRGYVLGQAGWAGLCALGELLFPAAPAVAAAPAAAAISGTAIAAIGGIAVVGSTTFAAYKLLQKADPDAMPIHAPTEKLDLTLFPKPTWLQVQGHINIGVMGASGTGKSTFINTLRGIPPHTYKKHRQECPGDLAESSSTAECTQEAKAFSIPADRCGEAMNAKLVRIWDLPGGNTTTHPSETYVRDKGLRWFDAVVVLTATRFSAFDHQLIAELRAYRIPFFCVRNKVDEDLKNARREEDLEDPDPHEIHQQLLVDEKTMQEIRADLVAKVGVANEQRIFLISSTCRWTKKPADAFPLEFDKLVSVMMDEISKVRPLPPIPHTWMKVKSYSDEGKLVPLAGSECKFWQEQLKMTDCCGGLGDLIVHEVLQVESPLHWKNYCRTKHVMKELFHGAPLDPTLDQFPLDPSIKEVVCFHGTTQDRVDSLIEQGFNMLKVNSNCLYGCGFYFCRSACKVAQYTSQHEKRDKPVKQLGPELRCLIVFRVLVGNPFFPKDRLIGRTRPPCKEDHECVDPNCNHHQFDSVVADQGIANRGRQNHEEVVIFNPNQVYPTHVIKFSGK